VSRFSHKRADASIGVSTLTSVRPDGTEKKLVQKQEGRRWCIQQYLSIGPSPIREAKEFRVLALTIIQSHRRH